MPSRRSETVGRDLEALFHVGIVSGTSDEKLLERFMAGQGTAGQAAFEEIVRRHGPMVLGVCGRILADPSAAEDAFQATFLVLALKAGAVRNRESLGAWLHGVSVRVARRARVTDRRRREVPLSEDALARSDHDATKLAELRSILDEELGRLPEKYRRPVVLCYLEGQTQEEAARVLGWSKGTVSGRLARAKDLPARPAGATRVIVHGGSCGRLPGACNDFGGRALVAFAAHGSGRDSRPVDGFAGQHHVGTGQGPGSRHSRGDVRGADQGGCAADTAGLQCGRGCRALGVEPSIRWPAARAARNLGGKTRDQGLALIVGAGFTPDGKTVVAAFSDGLVRLWDRPTTRDVRVIDLLEAGGDKQCVLRDFAMSTDGRVLAVVGCGRDSSRQRLLQGIWIWNLVENRLVRRIDVKTTGLQSLAFSPEGASLATGDQAGTIQLWDVASGDELLTLKLGKTAIDGLAISPDGMTLAATSLGSGVQLWDLGGGKALGAVDGGSQPLALSPRFSPDGSLLAFATPAGEVIVWDRVARKVRMRARSDSEESLVVAFAPDLLTLAVCGGLSGKMTVFETATGRKLWDVNLEPDAAAVGVAYAPDGKTIVAGRGGFLTFLDAATGNLQNAY